jgi:hypothetical protein
MLMGIVVIANSYTRGVRSCLAWRREDHAPTVIITKMLGVTTIAFWGSFGSVSTIKVGMETTVLVTGNQLKAARALAGVDQQQVADSAGVNVNTIRNMEARGAKPITSSAVTVRRVQLALEALGIEFLNHAQPGVRLRERRRAKG